MSDRATQQERQRVEWWVDNREWQQQGTADQIRDRERGEAIVARVHPHVPPAVDKGRAENERQSDRAHVWSAHRADVGSFPATVMGRPEHEVNHALRSNRAAAVGKCGAVKRPHVIAGFKHAQAGCVVE
jgi:hypothetical protein